MSTGKKLKVLFVIPHLGAGGAERVLIQLLKHLDRGKLIPILAVFNKRGAFLDQIPRDIEILDLEKRSRYSFIGLQRRIKTTVSAIEPSLVVPFMNYSSYLTLMSRALFGWSAPVMLSLHTTLSVSLHYQSFARVRKVLMKSFYPRAEAIVTVSNGSKRDLLKLITLPEDKVHVIYNPVDVGLIGAAAAEAVDFGQCGRPEIIAVGRLTAAKDYPTLLRAFRRVAGASEAHLTIMGEGEERQALERISRDLGLEGRVTFMGFVPSPYRYISRAEMLVLSSAWEGFATVIVEAMACGTPVVSTDCPSGPGEIITDGEDGLLVPVGDDAKLAQAMIRLLEDRDLRDELGRGARRRVEDFRVERIAREYEFLMLEVAGGA